MMTLGIILTIVGALVAACAYIASKTEKFEDNDSFNRRVAALFLGGTGVAIVGVFILISPYMPLP